MKKLHLFLVVAIAAVSASCSKDESQVNADELLIPANYSSHSLKWFIDDPGHELDGCVLPGGNCLPEIIVKPGLFTQLKSSGMNQMQLVDICGSNLNKELIEFANEGALACFSLVYRENVTYVVIKNKYGEVLQVQPYRAE